jgi:hypothetical protein
MILIRVEDRLKFGFGNRSRALAIALFCKQANIPYNIIASNINWLEQIKEQGLNFFQIQDISGKVSEAKRIIYNFIKKDHTQLTIIVDGARFKPSFFEYLNGIKVKTILIDDLASPIRDNVSAVINPNIYASEELYKLWDTKKFLGKDFIFFRLPFFKTVTPLKKNKNILISLGGSGSKTLIESLRISLTDKGFRVVASANFSADEMVDAIDNATYVICGASITLHEVLIRKRIPIPFIQVKDQILFIDYLKDKIPFVNVINNNNSSVIGLLYKIIDLYENNLTFKESMYINIEKNKISHFLKNNLNEI